MPYGLPEAWYIAVNTDYRIGLPTKVSHKALMHYEKSLWTVCEGEDCAQCMRKLYAEKRYCLPIVVYKGRNWVSAEVKYWEIGHQTANQIGRIYKTTPGVDLLVTMTHQGGLNLKACADTLLQGHKSEDLIRNEIESLLKAIPPWRGYVPPLPPPPPKVTRMSLVRGD